jgi:YgiT-type zinc finger domain-containing protein
MRRLGFALAQPNLTEWKYLVRGDTFNGRGICVVAKISTTGKLVTRSFGKKNNLLIVEDIPVVSCTACGESCMTAETLHEIERIKMHRHSFAIKTSIWSFQDCDVWSWKKRFLLPARISVSRRI